jgi:hypothetical protein
MSIDKKHSVVKVPVIENEAGWGSKIDDYMVCLTSEDARLFVDEFNSKNTEKQTPAWYMRADFDPRPITITDKQMKALRKNKRAWLSTLNGIK